MKSMILLFIIFFELSKVLSLSLKLINTFFEMKISINDSIKKRENK